MTDSSGPIKPIVVGDREVKVSRNPSKKRDRVYLGFIADLRPFGLKTVWASTLEKLEEKVRAALAPLTGEADKLTLERSALREYERAKTLGAELRVDLDEGLQRLRDHERLAASKGCTVEQAIDYWARHHDQSKFGIPVPQVTDLFIADLKRSGNKNEDIAGVKSKVKAFARAFLCPLREITVEMLVTYFAALGGEDRNRLNHRNEVRRFFNWARDRGYLPIDHPGIPRFVGNVKPEEKRVSVFDMKQRELLIAQANPDERPITLLKAYLPIRAKEAGYSRWENIDWEVGILMVWGDEAKTGEPRPLYLPRELCQRLRPLAKATGPIYPFKSYYKVGPRIARKAGLKWIRNGWRKTVISHLQAAINNRERVAEEAGTSVQKLKSNYLKYLRPDVGRAYFGLNKGERHPTEPGYNAEQYGAETSAEAEPAEEVPNVVTVEFGAHGG